MTESRRIFTVPSIFFAVALALGSPGCSASVEEEDDRAIKAIEALGGKVVRDENVPGRPVTSVEFAKVTDAGLKQVARLKRVTSITLAGTEVSDAGLKELAGLRRLRSLDLTGTPVTDAGLTELKAVKNLHRLIVTDTKTTDAGVAELEKALPDCMIQR